MEIGNRQKFLKSIGDMLSLEEEMRKYYHQYSDVMYITQQNNLRDLTNIVHQYWAEFNPRMSETIRDKFLKAIKGDQWTLRILQRATVSGATGRRNKDLLAGIEPKPRPSAALEDVRQPLKGQQQLL